MKLATWNVNSLRVRLPHLLDWLAAQSPDVACLQETKCEDAGFPSAELRAAGYESLHHGQRTYNGVAILSRVPAKEVCRGIPAFVDEQSRVIAADVAGIRVVSVYVPNGQAVGSDKFAYKLRWFEALARVAAVGFSDAFRLFDQPEKSFSWWDYRMGAFRRNMGLRIDHVLLSPELARSCRSCTIDVAPRRLERPSDHAPVVCELAIP